jgi:hypothetical protein
MPLIICQELHFIRNGIPAHFSAVICGHLNQKFPSQIVKGGTITWSPRSHDLNLLDYYLWGHLKLVYSFVSSG